MDELKQQGLQVIGKVIHVKDTSMLIRIHAANEVNNIMGTFYKVISILCLGYILLQVSALRTSFDDLQGLVS